MGDEIKLKDWCIEEFANNAHEQALNEKDKKFLMAKSDDLKQTIENLTKEVDVLNAEIAQTQLEMKKAGEDREAENKEFQQTVADQRATQKLLAQALNVLKGFYDKKAKAAFVQQGQPAGPAPPPGFKAYKKNAAASGVMGM